MRNLIVSSFTILLLIFSSCEEDTLESLEIFANENTEHSSKSDLENFEKDDFIEHNKEGQILTVNSLYLDCISDSKFVVRATYNDQTNSISFEYYDNSANTSLVSPVSIDWTVDNGLFPVSDSGSETGAGFIFNRDYNVGISIAFDDNSTFQDVFCVNIDQANANAFNVCSKHETTISCIENSSGRNKRTLVVIEIIF